MKSSTSIPYFEYSAGYLASKSDSQVPKAEPTRDLQENSLILTVSMVRQLRNYIPDMYKNRTWKLIYSPRENGLSMQTFLRLGEEAGANILVVVDENKNIFGAFLPHSWQATSRFYGTGEDFLFTFHNTELLTCYFPTMRNDYFISSDLERIIFGSG